MSIPRFNETTTFIIQYEINKQTCIRILALEVLKVSLYPFSFFIIKQSLLLYRIINCIKFLPLYCMVYACYVRY